MKKKSYLLAIAFVALMQMPSIKAFANPWPVMLEVKIDDPTYSQGNQNKSPILIPEISIEDYTLYFYTPCDGNLLRIVGEGGTVVYSTVIPIGATSLVLPSYLSGEYELQLIQGNLCFYGDITL